MVSITVVLDLIDKMSTISTGLLVVVEITIHIDVIARQGQLVRPTLKRTNYSKDVRAADHQKIVVSGPEIPSVMVFAKNSTGTQRALR